MPTLAVSGLPAGGMYALAALGIVLIYRTTGTLTFAQGAIATATAFVFNELWVERSWPVGLAIAAALLVAVLMGLGVELVLRLIGEGQVLAHVIATLGLSGLVLYVCDRVFGEETKFVPKFLPASTFELLGVRIGWDQASIVVIAAVLAIALGLVLTRTRVGTAVRAASQNRLAANLAGLPVRRLQLVAWASGALLAGIAGILLAPLLFLDTVQLSLFFLVKPFAAAVVGGLTSLSAAFAAGLAIGMIENVLTRWDFLPGIKETVPIAIILVSLVLRQRVAATESPALVKAPATRPGRTRPWGGLVAFGVLAAVLPTLSVSRTTTFVIGVVFALLALSLVVLTGWVGQVSLAQGAFFGVGGFMAANLANRAGLPFEAVLVLVPLTVVPVAIAVGLPALRFRGLLLAVVTLAFASVSYSSLFQWRTFVGDFENARLPVPELLGFDLTVGHRYAYVVLSVAGLVFLAVRNLGRHRAGGALFGVRDSEEGAASLGIPLMSTKLVAFALSGAIAGLAGCLLAYGNGVVSFDQYSPYVSFNIFAIAVFGGIESLWGAALAGLLYAVPPEILDSMGIKGGVQLVSSAGVVLSLIAFPGGLASLPGRVRGRVRTGRVPRLAFTLFGGHR